MTWPEVSLEEVCLQTSLYDPRLEADSIFRYVDISGVDRHAKTIVAAQRILGANAPARARKRIASGDILVSMVRPNLNAVAIVPDELDGAIASTGFCVLRADCRRVSSRFLFYFAISKEFTNFLVSRVRGANYPAVAEADVKAASLILPPLSEQRRVVAILDKAYRLCELRAEADLRASHILSSLFVHIFGDPVKNRRQWKLFPLGMLGTLDRGSSRHRPRNDPALLGGPYPLVQTGDIAKSGGRIRSYAQTYSELGLQQSRLWPAGTLCITIAANIARTGILEFDACFPDSVVGFIPGERVTVEFVQAWLELMQPTLEIKAAGFAQKNINLQTLRSLPVMLPPRELQELFSGHAKNFYKQQARRVSSAELLSKLLSSLVQRAFTGQLTASWRQVHMTELLQEISRQVSS